MDKDLADTTDQLITHLKDHSLLSKENIPLMSPLEDLLKECFKKMKSAEIPSNKNYFALSLKLFFKSLSDQELELICHNYIHNWINDHLTKSTKFFNKYQVE